VAMHRILAPLLAALVLVACGGGGGTAVDEDATLLLDFQPNAVHAGIYVGTSRGYFEAEGVDLDVEIPGQSTDALKLLESGDADLAILDIHDLGLARAKGADIVGVMALDQRPLAAILAQPEIRTPKDLEGERVGVTGLPSDDAVLESILRGGGAAPAKVRKTTIGFEAVRALVAGRVAGATAFWNAEGVALQAEKPGVREFRVDDFGAPRYPELVLVVARRTLDENPDLVRSVIRAMQRGYVETIKDPESAVTAMTDEVRDLERGVLEDQLDAVAPAFFAGERDYGRLVPSRLEEWADWDVEFGILEERPSIDSAFDTTLVGRSENP
jgi:putative hydroxymethylpyrimidine transport system substrate-binding protein